MRKEQLTPEQQMRADSLVRAAKSSFKARFKPSSKRDARQEHNSELRKKALARGEDPNKLGLLPSPFLHWSNTVDAYLAIISNYINWLVRVYPDVTTLKHKDRLKHAREYIQGHIDNNYSPSSIKTYRSALGKLHGADGAEIHDDVPSRIAAENKRSRGYTLKQYKKDVKKHSLAAEIPRITGVRRETLRTLRKEFFLEDNDGMLFLKLGGKKATGKTKGGRPYNALIIPSNQARIREILAQFKEGELICPNPPVHLDIHGIRSIYGEDLYGFCARDIADIPTSERVILKKPKIDNSRPNQIRTTAPSVYTRDDGRPFDRIALEVVSQALGHGADRVDVVTQNYLWRFEPPTK